MSTITAPADAVLVAAVHADLAQRGTGFGLTPSCNEEAQALDLRRSG